MYIICSFYIFLIRVERKKKDKIKIVWEKKIKISILGTAYETEVS